jgi:hypothetical protein
MQVLGDAASAGCSPHAGQLIAAASAVGSLQADVESDAAEVQDVFACAGCRNRSSTTAQVEAERMTLLAQHDCRKRRCTSAYLARD